MAQCPFCHQDKPFAASVCHHCNTEVPFMWQVKMTILRWVVVGVLFYVPIWLLLR